MGKKKLKRFADMATFPNVFEPKTEDVRTGNYPMKGQWKAEYFKNDNPIVLELGCGKGEYTVGLAEKFPEKNFIGLDIKGNRMWVGAKKAIDTSMKNVAFLRTRVDFIESFFEKGEVDEIWITFPDPQPQLKRERKRLTSPRFIDRYKKLLKEDGIIHLKTDSKLLHHYTVYITYVFGYPRLEQTADLYGEALDKLDAETRSILSIQTHYEKLFMSKGEKITYLKFKLK